MPNISQNRKYLDETQIGLSEEQALLSAKHLVVDCETTGLNPRTDHIVGVAFSVSSDWGIYCSMSNSLDFVQRLLQTSGSKIFHNAVFDLSMFKAAGIAVQGPLHDTMLLAHLHNPDREHHGLKDLAKELLGPDATVKDVEIQHWLHHNKLTKKDLSRAPKDLLAAYACEDAMNTFALFQLFGQKFKEVDGWLKQRGFSKTPLDIYKEETQQIIPVVVDMQLKGVKLDLDKTSSRKTELQKRITEIESKLKNDCAEWTLRVEKSLHSCATEKRKARNKTGKLKKELAPIYFNWESRTHLSQLLFGVLGEPILKKTKKGHPSLDAEVLEKYVERQPWVSSYLELAELKKLVGTYLNGLLERQESGVIHAHFNLAGTTTGRFSSSDPNLQNLPKHGNIKELFVARAGHKFIYGDYSQLELRLAAHLSQDPLLLSAYQQGLDLHKETAATIYTVPVSEIASDDPRRDVGKRVNFAIIYNASGWRIAEILGLMSGLALDDRNGKKKAALEGEAIIKKLFGKYKGLKLFVDKQMAKMLQYNCAVSELGYCRRLPGLRSTDRQEYNHSLKAGFNLPIQGLGASICKRAMVELHKQGFVLINQIHDSICVEIQDNGKQENEAVCRKIKDIMEGVVRLTVPLVVEPKILTSFAER